MADKFRIRREADGAVFEYDNPIQVPAGFSQVGGGPLNLQDTLRSGAKSVIKTGDKFLGKAREGVGQYQQKDKLGPLGGVLADVTNPIPGDTAQAAAMAATLPIRGSMVTGPLMRAGAAGAAGGAVEAVKGEENPLTAGARYAGGQLIGEIPGVVAQGAMNQRALSKAQGAIDQKTKFNKAMTGALTGADKAGHKQAVADSKLKYEQDVARIKQGHAIDVRNQKLQFENDKRIHGQQAAVEITKAWDDLVPSWRGMPQDEAGLVDRIFGSGQQKLSDMYEAAMKSALEQAKGKQIMLSPRDAADLGIRVPAEIMDFGPGAMDADVIIKAMTGKSQSARGAYRRAAAALDEAGIGDPAVRAEYKSGMGLIDFVNKTKALQSGQFNPSAVLKGLTDLRSVNMLRHRGLGSATEGPLADVTTNIPQKPTPLTPPQLPPKPVVPPAPTPRMEPPTPQLPEGFQTRTVPDFVRQHPFITAGLAGGGLYGGGVPGGLMGGAGLLAGLLLGGKQLATRAPLSPLQEMGLRGMWSLGGSGVRGTVEGETTEE